MKIFKNNFLIIIGIIIAIIIPTKIFMEYSSVKKELDEEKGDYEECLTTAKGAIDSSRKLIDNVKGKISYETMKSIGISSLLNYEKAIKDCETILK